MIKVGNAFDRSRSGYPVYACLINDGDRLVSKMGMTRIADYGLIWHDYAARTSSSSQFKEMLRASVLLIIHLGAETRKEIVKSYCNRFRHIRASYRLKSEA